MDIDQRLGGRYRLEEAIGYGSMGRVFRATDELLDRPVAIKLLDRSLSDKPDEIAEARAAARLSHPGVVHVFDAGVSDAEGQAYIVMELVSGPSLRDVLRERGKLPPAYAAELAAELADALEAIHRLGMVHCDVKPLNIIITDSGHPKLVDFGIARAAAAAGESLGSAAYVAPEQARGEPVDGRADVYALGAVFYEMLVGDKPFGAASATEQVRRKLADDPPSPRSVDARIPRDLEAIALRALAREPASRFATAADMRDALRTAIARAAEPTQPLQLPPPPRPQRVTARPNPVAQTPAARRVRPLIGPPTWLSETRTVAAPWPTRTVIAVAAALVIAAVAVAGWRITHPSPSGVPHLVGLQLSDVPKTLEDAGIAPADVTVLTRPVEPQYVGKVIDQQPQPGLPRGADSDLQIAVGVSQ